MSECAYLYQSIYIYVYIFVYIQVYFLDSPELLSFLSLTLSYTTSLVICFTYLTLILPQPRVVLEEIMGEELEEVLFTSTNLYEIYTKC